MQMQLSAPARREGTTQLSVPHVPGRDTRRMATVTVVAIERSGPAIRAALAEHAPGDEHRFATELRDALARAADDLDPPRPQAVLARWHVLATMAANPRTRR